MRDLAVDEIEVVSGGAATCTYESKTYSEGSVIKMSDNANHSCGADGKWS